MRFSAGTRWGSFEITGALGAGGMGEVYRALAPRLGREVAIKVLASCFAEDTDRVRRFEQEARTVAALNHPNILAMHDIGALSERNGSSRASMFSSITEQVGSATAFFNHLGRDVCCPKAA